MMSGFLLVGFGHELDESAHLPLAILAPMRVRSEMRCHEEQRSPGPLNQGPHGEALREERRLVVLAFLPDLLETHQIGTKLLQRVTDRIGPPFPEPPAGVLYRRSHGRPS